MPQFTWSTAMTANQLGLNPLSGWQYEFLPWPAEVILLMRATTTGVRNTIFSGSETIQERTPMQSGGTAGTTPSELNTAAIAFNAAAGDRLKLVLDEVLERRDPLRYAPRARRPRAAIVSDSAVERKAEIDRTVANTRCDQNALPGVDIPREGEPDVGHDTTILSVALDRVLAGSAEQKVFDHEWRDAVRHMLDS